ncbi:MAG: transposase [Cyanobacteria bacterium P01_H01_bin.153]
MYRWRNRLSDTVCLVPRGQVVNGERSSQRQPRQNLLAARNPQEFLATVMIAGSITAMVFKTWLKQHLCPILPPRSLLILDNTRFHRPDEVTTTAEAAGYQGLFLPSYSPDFNKFKHDFAALKNILAYAPESTTLDEYDPLLSP